MEEDIVSQSEDSSQVNVLSVSVTFRQHTSEEADQTEPNKISEAARGDNNNNNNNNSSSSNNNNNNNDKSSNDSDSNIDCSSNCDFKSFTKLRSKSFPSNPPATPEISTEESNISSEPRGKQEEPGHTESAAVLKGWKGYSNNIYIQPIIVHNAVAKNSQYASLESRRCRLTSEDLRKQMRIRESSSWITKHNDLINSTGSLRVGESSDDPRQDDVNTRKPRIWKGFACRRWASEFLPVDHSDDEEEYTPFTIRRYVDRSSHAPAKRFHTNGIRHPPLGGQINGECDETLEVNIGSDGKDTIVDTSLVMPMNVEKSKTLEEHDSEVQSISPTDFLLQQTEASEEDFVCPCKIDIYNAPAFRARTAAPTCQDGRRAMAIQSSRKSKPLGIALPVKQFPPINPLQDAKKRPAQVQKRGSYKIERPHTVDAACVQRGLLKVSARSEMPRRLEGRSSDVHRQVPRRIIGSRISSCPPLTRKDPRRFPSTISRETSLESNDTLRYADYDLGRWSTNGGSDTSLQENNNDIRKANNDLANHKTNAWSGSRTSNGKSLPQSSRRKDRLTSAVTDVSVNGMGSEFELSPNGFNKLDVFLKPWVDHTNNAVK